MITVKCKKCGREIEVENESTLKSAKCSGCSSSISNAPLVKKRKSHYVLVSILFFMLSIAGLAVFVYLNEFKIISKNEMECYAAILMFVLVGSIPGIIARGRDCVRAYRITLLGYVGIILCGILWIYGFIYAIVGERYPAADNQEILKSESSLNNQ